MDRIETFRGARAPRLAGLAAIAAALALASPAGAAPLKPAAAAPAKPAAPAQPKPAATPPAAPAGAPAPVAPSTPAPRAPAPSAAAAAGAPARVAWLGGSLGALAAFDTGDSMSMEIDYGILRTPPSWERFDLEWHLVVGLSRPTGEAGLTATVVPPGAPGPVAVSAGQEEVTALLVKIVPTARVVWTAGKLAFFGDAGLGLVQSFESYDRSELFMGHSEHREYATGVVLRLGAGLAAQVAPRWRVLFAPAAVDLMLGPKFSAWTPSLGVAYRL